MHRKNPARKKCECYPDFSAELQALKGADGHYSISELSDIVAKIIRKHRRNAAYNRKLFERYRGLEEGVPIFSRSPRFPQQSVPINNKLSHDFFSEIVDIKTGYFAGKPIAYSYSSTAESKSLTGSAETEETSKELTDFMMRSGMYGTDMQCVKHAAICGYGARLLYIDRNAVENVMTVLPYQAAILTETGDISEPSFAVRYYRSEDLSGSSVCHAEFYDSSRIYNFIGGSFDSLKLAGEPKIHLFDSCPLQGIPNNDEMIADAEKVLSLIDAYDRAVSDSGNEAENFAQAYMVYKNIMISDEELEKSQRSGSIRWNAPTDNADVYFLTKNINDTFLQNFLNRLRDDIYHLSKTPNFHDETFGNASGVSLKYKLLPLETKCGMLQARFQTAGMYMFRLLSSSWKKRLRLNAVPEQFLMDFKRNFPLDALSEAQAAQAMIASGLPKRVVYGSAYSFVDDPNYVMGLIAEEENGTVSLYKTEDIPNDRS